MIAAFNRWAYSEEHAERRVLESLEWCAEDAIGTVRKVRR